MSKEPSTGLSIKGWKWRLAWLLLGVMAFALTHAAEVSGPISTNTTWTAAQAPYTVTADVTVENGATLTIEPGVTVFMRPATNLTVNNGALRALGTASAPIVITSANDVPGATPAPGDWGQLRFLDGTNDTATVLEHVQIKYGQGIAVQSASPTFNRLDIRNHAGPAISMDLQSSPVGSGNQASGNAVNGVVVPAGDILGRVTWGLQGIPYVVPQGTVSVGQSPSISGINPNQIQQGETLIATITGVRLSGAERIIFDNPNLSGTVLSGGTETSIPVQITAAAATPLGPTGFAVQVAASRPRLAAGLTVVQTQAKLTALEPNTLYTTQPEVTLTVTGQNFVAESVVLLDGTALPTTYVSTTTLTAQVPTQAVGIKTITVRSPDPRNPGNFLISNPLDLYVVVPSARFTPASLSLVRGTSGTLTLNVPYAAPAGGLDFALSSDASIATVPATVTVPEGATSVAVPVTAVAAGSTNVAASRNGFNTGYATVTVTLPPTVLLPATSLVSPGLTGTLALTLNVPAPAGGLTLTLTSSDPNVATVPATFSIAEGQTSASIPVTGVGVGTATITASAPGYDPGTTTISVENVDFTVALEGSGTFGNSLSVPEGATALFQARLSRPAPAGGLSFTLATGDSAIATVGPITVNVPAGATSVAQTIAVTGVARGSTTLTASAPGLNTSTLTLTVTDRLQLQFTRTSVTVGAGLRTYQYEVSMCRTQNYAYYYASTTLTVNLVSSDTTYATVPPSVTIPYGAACASFQVTGVAVTGATAVNIDATATGYLAPATKLAVNVVTPTFRIDYLNDVRSTLSRPDDLLVRPYVPGAWYPYDQTPAAPLTVNIAVTDANPAGIVQIYDGYSYDPSTREYTYGNVVSQFTLGTNQNRRWLYLGRPTAPGSYTVTLSADGFTPFTSAVQTVLDGSAARLEFSRPSLTVGKALNSYLYEVSVRRMLGDYLLYDADDITVTLTSADPMRVGVPASVTIAGGSGSAYFTLSGLELTGASPVAVTASAPGYNPTPSPLAVSVVSPQLEFTELDGARSTLSTQRDRVCADLFVPGATYPYAQSPINPLTVDWSVTDANPPGIVTLYDGWNGENVIAQAPVGWDSYTGRNRSCVYVGQPTAPGSYTLTASIAGLTAATSPVQTVSDKAARLVFSRPSLTIGNGMDSGAYGVYVSRQAYPGVAYDLTQPLTVTLASSDATKVAVPATVTIAANSSAAYFTITGVGLTSGAPVTVDAAASGLDAPAAKLSVNVVAPTLALDYLDGTRSPLSDRDDFFVRLTVPGADAVAGNAVNPITVNLAATDIGPNLLANATFSASSAGVSYRCSECGYKLLATPEAAADGALDTAFETENAAPHAWWQADLGTVQTIDRVSVQVAYPRTAIAVLLASQPFVESDFSSDQLPSTFSNGAAVIYQTGSMDDLPDPDTPIVLSGPFTGRYLRVVTVSFDPLGLREVQAFQGGGSASGIVSFYDQSTGGSAIAQLVIPAGQNGAWVYVGTPTATGNYVVTASAPGVTPVTSAPQVVDLPRLQFGGLDWPEVRPGQTIDMFVAASGTVPADTTVTLTSSNPSVATVTATATIAAGSRDAPIVLTTLAEGTTTITASAPGFKPVSLTITVTANPTGPPV